jgi:hypothetical protein
MGKFLKRGICVACGLWGLIAYRGDTGIICTRCKNVEDGGTVNN